MNKVNGYCQIELPDRVNITDLTSTLVTLTKEEARPIIDKLGLGGIKLPDTDEERTHDAVYKMIKDALVRKPAYIVTKRSLVDGITIVPALIMDQIEGSDTITIHAVVEKAGEPAFISIDVDLTTILEVETVPTIYDLEISIQAYKINTTRIS